MEAGGGTLDGMGRRVSPLVIAHRGASGELPENTLPAYELAVEQGAVWVRRLLIAVVIVAAANLLGLFELIGNLFNFLFYIH